MKTNLGITYHGTYHLAGSPCASKLLSKILWRSMEDDEYQPVQPAGGLEGDYVSTTRYGAAVDLGTSHIRMSLWDLSQGRRIAAQSAKNPQENFGSDILTRLTAAAASRDQVRAMSAATRAAIGQGLVTMLEDASLDPGEAGPVIVVGNTAMLALLAEKNYQTLLNPVDRMRGIDCSPDHGGAWFSPWDMPGAAVRIMQPLAGFVGSDFLADILATRLAEDRAGSLLIDFGVNTEVALWDGGSLWAASAAGGPAFEGSGITNGMAAEPGAVFRVSLDHAGGFQFDVIGGGKPEGICGSGFVDLIRCSLDTGALAPNGRLQQSARSLQGPAGMSMTAGDVDAFQRAKAAVAACTGHLLGKAGMGIRDLRRVCICGAFGRHLDPRNAGQIGLIPPVPPVAIELCGNSALTGCELLLLDPARGEVLEFIRQVTRFINQSQSRGFEELFIDNLRFSPMKERRPVEPGRGGHARRDHSSIQRSHLRHGP